ncbi:MAG: ABC transporter permease [Chloroflexota bacterium]
MGRYIARRLFHSIFVLIGLTIVVFVISRIIGDPARLMLPLTATEQQYLDLREALGLNDPEWVQFVRFAGDVARADFGQSMWQHVPALPLIVERVPATLLLAFVTIAFAVGIAVPLGVVAAVRPRSITERIITVFSLGGVCVPDFWLGLMLILVLAVGLGWFPTSGYGSWEYIVLPMLTLTFRPLGRISQVVASSMLDELSKPYITTAQAKGLSERVVVFYHALKNAAIPIITLTGDEIANLTNGAVVVETVFAWPGVGLLFIQAIQRRDFPVIQAAVFVVALGVIAINLVVDLLYAYADPRVRYK